MHPGLLFAAWLASTALAVVVTSTAVDQVADHVGPDPGIVLLGRAPAGADAPPPVVGEPAREAAGPSGSRAAGTPSGATGRPSSGAARPAGGAVPASAPAPAQAPSRGAAPGPGGAEAPAPAQAPAPPRPRPPTAPPPERRQAPAARPPAPSTPTSSAPTSRPPSSTPPSSRPPSSAPPDPAPAQVEARSCSGGRVEVRLADGRLSLHRVVPAAGVAVEVDERGPERVRVEFTPAADDGEQCRVRAELVGGRVAWRVEEDR